ncbi:MAG: RNA pseudouridine synthase, partial [Oscillospiraceae bacterium]|nr:RNA pseudouridine synthase [Oscillospiraceae bacterium]
METTLLQVNPDEEGARIDSFISARLEGVTRSAAARLLAEGQVLLNGRTAAKSARVAAGDSVSVTQSEPVETELAAQDIPLSIVYEDADVIVV